MRQLKIVTICLLLCPWSHFAQAQDQWLASTQIGFVNELPLTDLSVHYHIDDQFGGLINLRAYGDYIVANMNRLDLEGKYKLVNPLWITAGVGLGSNGDLNTQLSINAGVIYDQPILSWLHGVIDWRTIFYSESLISEFEAGALFPNIVVTGLGIKLKGLANLGLEYSGYSIMHYGLILGVQYQW